MKRWRECAIICIKVEMTSNQHLAVKTNGDVFIFTYSEEYKNSTKSMRQPMSVLEKNMNARRERYTNGGGGEEDKIERAYNLPFKS
jgi:hypothetical protein